MSTDLAIARAASPLPITAIADRLGLTAADILPFGHHKAKLAGQPPHPNGHKPKLVLVTAITPTPAGEGKTTTTVGLGDGLNRIGKRAVICLREPSMGPCFGMKGGATGGGHAQAIPMEDINLHFNGDFHAIGAAHNLLAAALDNHLHWGNALAIDPRRVQWRRVMDMNDRALRQIVTGLGGDGQGVPREAGFDITVASEVMAALCLAEDEANLADRLSRMVVAERADGTAVTAADLNVTGALCALLKEALKPNLVQTLENNPVLVHGGPFANIAHGCNSVLATRAGLALGEYVVTEAGFGADLGAEKFLNIKCRQAGLAPDAAVVVATVRALKMTGGVAKADLATENVAAVERGAANLARHLENLQKFGIPPIVAVNHFAGDSDDEIAAVIAFAESRGVKAVLCRHWAEGSAGIESLAHAVVERAEGSRAAYRPLYTDATPLADKLRTVAREIYRADDIVLSNRAARKLDAWQADGYGTLQVCMAKTQYSFSADPKAIGAPEGFSLPITDVRLSAGAGFIVALCGDIMTMPGLPRSPAAERIHLDADGLIAGLS